MPSAVSAWMYSDGDMSSRCGSACSGVAQHAEQQAAEDGRREAVPLQVLLLRREADEPVEREAGPGGQAEPEENAQGIPARHGFSYRFEPLDLGGSAGVLPEGGIVGGE